MDVSGKWQYDRENWSETSPDYKPFEGSFLNKYFDLSRFELIISKIRTSEDDESLLIVVKAPKTPFKEEKYSLTRINSSVQDHSVSLIVNSDQSVSSFTVVQLGPKPEQALCEHFRIDSQNRLHIIVTSVDANGKTVSMSRSFEKMEELAAARVVNFVTTEKSLGWNAIENFPAQTLELAQIKLESVIRYKDDKEHHDILFSLNQTSDEKQSVLFPDECQHYPHSFQFQVGFQNFFCLFSSSKLTHHFSSIYR
jgi:hypothetical protein